MTERRRTATSNFGVGRREAHDAAAFYARFEAPEIVTDSEVLKPRRIAESCILGDARHMDAVADGSVALVVTSPPYFAGKQYEEELEREGVPSSYLEYLEMLTDVFAECVREARAGRAHRRQRGQPRAQAVPQPLGRRDPHPRGRPRPAAARRADLAEGRGCQRLVRVGFVPQRGQSGVARHHRAGDRRQQGSLRSGPSVKERERRGLPHESTHHDRGLHGRDARRLVDPPESARRVGHPAPVPRRAARAAHPALHVRERSRARSVHGQRLGARRRGTARPPLRRLRPRSRVRRAGAQAGRGRDRTEERIGAVSTPFQAEDRGVTARDLGRGLPGASVSGGQGGAGHRRAGSPGGEILHQEAQPPRSASAASPSTSSPRTPTARSGTST